MSRYLIFADTETTGITPLGVHDGRGEIWELALITRDLDDLGRGDEEWAWHMRPCHLEHADPGSLKIGVSLHSWDALPEQRRGAA